MDGVTTINSKSISNQINKCYMEWHPGYPNNASVEFMNGFKYYLEHIAGLRIYFVQELDKTGRFGFRLDTVEVTDPKKYTLFLIKYS